MSKSKRSSAKIKVLGQRWGRRSDSAACFCSDRTGNMLGIPQGDIRRVFVLRMFLPSIYVSLKFVMQFSDTAESSYVHCLIDSHCLTISLLAMFSSCNTADFSSFPIGLQQRNPIAMNIRHSKETSLLPAISKILEFHDSNYKSQLTVHIFANKIVTL